MTECSREGGLHSQIYVVSNFQYQFSITCKNWMHKVSELLSKICNLSPKCSYPHPHPHTHTHPHATYKEKPLKILGIREDKATVNFFPPHIQNIFICIIHLAIYLFKKNYVSGTQLNHRARIILRLCTPIVVSRVPCTMTAPHDHCKPTRQTMV